MTDLLFLAYDSFIIKQIFVVVNNLLLTIYKFIAILESQAENADTPIGILFGSFKSRQSRRAENKEEKRNGYQSITESSVPFF
jgi:hypothetical protein